MQNNHAERAHSLLSASGADRWINCTPSARMEEEIPNKGSVYAEEGTTAHELCELKLRHSSEESKGFLAAITPLAAKCTKNGWDWFEMCEHANTYRDYVMEIFEQAKLSDELAELIIERKVDLTEWVENGFGTCDAIIVANVTLHVIDFKYGQGVKVSPADNSQLKLYGLGALREAELIYNIKDVELHIVQPRINHIESWKVSVKELNSWGELTVKPRALDAYAGKGKCNAGHWCKFCRVKPTCRAAKEAAFAVIKGEFEDPKTLTDTEIVDVLAKVEQAQDWFKSVEEYALQEALNGKKWNGYKLVEGRSVRKWADEEKVIDELSLNYSEEQFINKKIKGIGDIEKLVGKKEFPAMLGSLVIKPEGKPTLVPTSDKRQEWAKNSINDFND